MSRRPIEVYEPRGFWVDEVFYSEDALDAIICAVGRLPSGKIECWRLDATGADFESVSLDRRTALSEKLEKAARWWHAQNDNQTRPTSKQIADRFDGIEKKAAALLKALGTPDGELSQLPEVLRYGTLQAFAAQDLGKYPGQSAAQRLEKALTGVTQLRRWASKSKQKYQSQKQIPRKSRHAGDKALNDLIGELNGIYVDVFGKKPGISINSGTPTGPFIRYMRASLTPLMGDETPTDHAIRERWRSLRKLSQNKT